MVVFDNIRRVCERLRVALAKLLHRRVTNGKLDVGFPARRPCLLLEASFRMKSMLLDKICSFVYQAARLTALMILPFHARPILTELTKNRQATAAFQCRGTAQAVNL